MADIDRIWLQSYPPGVPATVDTRRYRSLVELFRDTCREYPDHPAYICMGRLLSYRELDLLSARFAAYLQRHTALSKGDRIAIMLPNVLQYPVALFGSFRAGLTVVNTNPLYTPRELHHQLTDSGAKAIVVLENFAHTLERVIDKTGIETVIVTGLGDLLGTPKGAVVNFLVRHIKRMVPAWNIPRAIRWREAITTGNREDLKEATLDQDDLAFLQYTGGTTGVAKGAMLTHGNMVANVEQAFAWIGGNMEQGKEMVVTALPLYHVFALMANALIMLRLGGCNLLITNPRDFKAFVKELGNHPFTFITGVNTLFNALLNTKGFSELDFSRLKISLAGGMAVQRSVARRWKEVTGHPMIEAWGLSETSPAACINPITITEFTGSIGLPIPSTDVSIQDEDGKHLAIGKIGEICVRGPQVMEGYWNRPDETAKVLSDEGWLQTGDMGRIDEQGFVYIVDRKKDMINVSGFNVFPNEVEDVLADHPDVLEVAVVGVPDDRSGETVKAVIVRKNPALTAESVIAHARDNLTAYKVPHQVEFRDELPKTNVGKILRRALRD